MLAILSKRKNQLVEIIDKPITGTPWFLKDKILPSLDGWRAIAIVLVILSHLRQSAPKGIQTFHYFAERLFFGGLGVQIFFVLSGFLITTLLVREKQKNGKINIRAFFIRRSLRIFPVLYLYLAVLIILNHYLNLELTIGYFIATALYIQNFAPFGGAWLVGHTWSLSVEEQFYLIWPFLFIRLTKTIHWIITLLCMMPIILVLGHYYTNFSLFLLIPFLKPAASIFSGALLSILVFKAHHIFEFSKVLSKKYLILFFFLIWAVSLLSSQGRFGKLLLPFGDTMVNLSICYVILYSLIKRNGLLFKILNSRIAIHLGVISYSLYIWQQLFILPIGTSKQLENLSFFPVNIVFALLTAIISYYVYEKPFLRLKSKFSA